MQGNKRKKVKLRQFFVVCNHQQGTEVERLYLYGLWIAIKNALPLAKQPFRQNL
jgi:hypothetical protein